MAFPSSSSGMAKAYVRSQQRAAQKDAPSAAKHPVSAGRLGETRDTQSVASLGVPPATKLELRPSDQKQAVEQSSTTFGEGHIISATRKDGTRVDPQELRKTLIAALEKNASPELFDLIFHV
eukprot:TRINITY_DN9198_c0_g1_i2.p2 TRINITY_DN9198_c0_g1~~TRINITY_DN9198_c0_g1_i2.p2  ORF type:complete len:122 (+),score=18.56 TRINITY_DN9198_c0_g1_i2:164-529(+)